MKLYQSKIDSGDYHYDFLNADYYDPDVNKTRQEIFNSNERKTTYTAQGINSLFRYSLSIM